MLKNSILMIAIFFILAPVVNAQDDVVVAMVADFQGQFSVESDGQVQPGEILAELNPGSKLIIGSDTTLTLFYFDSSEEFTYDTVGEVLIGEQQPQVLSGNQPSSRNLNMGELAGIAMEAEEGLSIGLLKLRGDKPVLRLISPNATTIMGPSSEFTWNPVKDAESYQFFLSDDLGLTIADINVTVPGLTLTDDIQLDAGGDYTWEVVAYLPEETEYRAQAHFSTLDSHTRQRVESALPAPDASFAERAVYARMLERLELDAAATKIWEELVLLRPDQASLQDRIQ